MASNTNNIYQLRFWIKNISPCIWRRVLVKEDCSIADLHYIIQLAMGWYDTYLNQFSIRGKDYGIAHEGGMNFSDNPTRIYLKDFNFHPNERFIYEYNFFDHWEIEIRIEENNVIDSKKRYPICIGGKRTAPPEDCRGAIRFMELVDYYSWWRIEEIFLESIKKYQSDNDNQEFIRILEKLNFWANLHHFDRRYVNYRLKQYATNDPQWEEHFDWR